MGSTITSSPDFVIRSLTTAPEIEAFYRLNAQVFRPDHDTVLIATRRRRFITEAPDFHPEQLRGAFLGTTYPRDAQRDFSKRAEKRRKILKREESILCHTERVNHP